MAWSRRGADNFWNVSQSFLIGSKMIITSVRGESGLWQAHISHEGHDGGYQVCGWSHVDTSCNTWGQDGDHHDEATWSQVAKQGDKMATIMMKPREPVIHGDKMATIRCVMKPHGHQLQGKATAGQPHEQLVVPVQSC
jgi:hypothetical protein